MNVNKTAFHPRKAPMARHEFYIAQTHRLARQHDFRAPGLHVGDGIGIDFLVVNLQRATGESRTLPR